MSELALGLTKTVVEGALSRIQWAIEEDDKLKEGVQQDLEFITGEFQMMQSFLKVANKERAKKNEVARAWVRQLRDLAFNVEDWVEFVAHLEKDKSRCSCWWRFVPSWAVPRHLAPPRHLDEAAAEMKLLKARVHDLSQRNTRYNLFSSDDSGSCSGLGSKTMTPSVADVSSTAFQMLCQVWMDETDRLHNVGSLEKLITSEVAGDDLQVIWIWEGDDLCHASRLIHMAYHGGEICRMFKRCAWVKITRPFNFQTFLNTLAAQLLFEGSSHHQASSDGLTSTAELIQLFSAELIQQVTKEQRYLVILEDVSDLVEWNTIRMYLPDNKKGSRIVVSTKNLQQAIMCTGVPYLVSELFRFTDGRPSICAFYKKVTERSDSAVDILIGKIKCGGVISVYGDGPRKSSVVKKTILSIRNKNPEILNGVRFEGCRWVPVGDPFNPVDFSRRLLIASNALGFYDGGLQELIDIFGVKKLEHALCEAKEEQLIKKNHEYLRQFENWLVVIDGLRSTEEWDVLVKSERILLPKDGPTNKCCVVVVTDDQTVARYCVRGNQDLLVHVREEVPVGTAQTPKFITGRDIATTWMRSISDPHLRKRRSSYEKLINDRIAVQSPHVASVWGFAGVGKSTLVKWSFNKRMLDPENWLLDPVNKCKFRYYCWVDVPHPFSLAELSQRLLRSFLSDYNIDQGKEVFLVHILESGRDPIEVCRLLLQRLKWLLVLDGLRSTGEWDTITNAFGLSQPTGISKTIVITTEKSVAMHCVNREDKQVVNVQGLQIVEALNLFNQKIGNSNIETYELSKSTVAKCGGLPKVIDVVANHYRPYRLDNSKLKDINDNFMHILEGSPGLRELFSWMQSYLETCKDDLKACIFYLPVFPLGHSIRLRRLLWRWTAEGYIRLDENIRRLVAEFVDPGMFVVQGVGPVKIEVNRFLHEYINSRPMEDDLVFTLEGPCRIQSQRAGAQHLTIRNNWKSDLNVFASIDFSRLRSLTVFGKCWPWMFDPTKIKMRYVRVLDLEDAKGVTNDDLKNIVEVFPRLKFLSLRGCREITRLPKSLGRLRQLQTLDIRYTCVATLPKAILKLQKLQHVRAGNLRTPPWDESGVMVPYQTTTPGEIISNSVTVQDGTTFAAAGLEDAPTPSATEDTSTPSAKESDLERTTIIETPPLSQVEVATTFAAAPSSHAEDASSTSSAAESDSEDTTIFATTPLYPAKVATTDVAAPSAPAEDAQTPSATASGSEDSTIFEKPTLSPAEVATTFAAAPSSHAEDASSTSSAAESDSENTTIFETTPLYPAKVATTDVAAPSAPEEGALSTSSAVESGSKDTTKFERIPLFPAEVATTDAAAPSAPAEDAQTPFATASGSEDTTIALADNVTTLAAAPTAPAEDSFTAAAAPRCRTHALVPSWLSKLGCQSQSRPGNNNHGVKVPAGIGKLTTLHTFGVANVGPGNKAVIVKELHKLTQLVRLGVCGINVDNISKFFSAIAGLNHLERLSVGLDKKKDGLFPSLDDTIARPPESLLTLKLHGHVRILPGSWIKELVNVGRLDLEVTLQEQYDMQVILDHLMHRTRTTSQERLCIKTIHDAQQPQLRIGINDEQRFGGLKFRVLEIVCTTNLQATIGNIGAVDVLRVECCTGSSLQLSGLHRIRSLKEVWLKGSCSDELKQDLQRQLDKHQDKPVLKVLQRRSS